MPYGGPWLFKDWSLPQQVIAGGLVFNMTKFNFKQAQHFAQLLILFIKKLPLSILSKRLLCVWFNSTAFQQTPALKI